MKLNLYFPCELRYKYLIMTIYYRYVYTYGILYSIVCIVYKYLLKKVFANYSNITQEYDYAQQCETPV